MKRTIEFKGIRVDNGEFIYGWLFRDILTGTLAIQQTTSKKSKDTGHLVISHTSREVIPSTVGQYTGLKDRDRQKIYEWDQVKYGDNERIYTVEYKENLFCLTYHGATIVYNWNPSITEVVGNLNYKERLIYKQE